MTAAEEAARAGIDLSLIELGLGYTYDKRAEQHQAALELERIGRERKGITRDRREAEVGHGAHRTHRDHALTRYERGDVSVLRVKNREK